MLKLVLDLNARVAPCGLVSIMRGPITNGTNYPGLLIRYPPAVRALSAVVSKKSAFEAL